MKLVKSRGEDRLYLQRLSDALLVSFQRIRLDQCRDWNIFGTNGHIFTDTKFWYLFISPGSKRLWTSIKNKLKFMEPHQDGDEEGILKLQRMPSTSEAKIIRKVLGLRHRTELTDQQRIEFKNRFKTPCQKGV